jgi:hypothetical protein
MESRFYELEKFALKVREWVLRVEKRFCESFRGVRAARCADFGVATNPWPLFGRVAG